MKEKTKAKVNFDLQKDKEVEIFLARTEIEGIISIAQGILCLARVLQANPERLRKLGIYVFQEEKYPEPILRLLRQFNPDAYSTPITLETAFEIINDFFMGVKRRRRGESYIKWLTKNL